jgi:hypothetical protein
VALVRGRPKNYRFYNLTCSGRFYQVGVAAFTLAMILGFTGSIILECIRDFPSPILGDFAQVAEYIASYTIEVAIVVIICGSLGSLMLHFYSDIGVGPKGLAVQVYIFFWKVITWDSVLTVRIPRDLRRYLLKDRNQWMTAIVTVRHLTFWHRLFMIGSTRGFRPGFLITPLHNNREQLLKEILDHVDKRAGWKAKRQR